jgi:hypothetical protein
MAPDRVKASRSSANARHLIRCVQGVVVVDTRCVGRRRAASCGGRGVAPGWPVTAVATTMDRLTWDEANELRARGGRALRRGELVEVDRSDESAARPRQPPAASRATRDVSATRPRGARTWRAIPRSTKASRPHRIPCRCLWTIAQRATSPLPQNPTVWLPRRVDPHCRRFEPSPAGRLDARTHDASPRPDHAPTSTTSPARVAGDLGCLRSRWVRVVRRHADSDSR